MEECYIYIYIYIYIYEINRQFTNRLWTCKAWSRQHSDELINDAPRRRFKLNTPNVARSVAAQQTCVPNTANFAVPLHFNAFKPERLGEAANFAAKRPTLPLRAVPVCAYSRTTTRGATNLLSTVGDLPRPTKRDPRWSDGWRSVRLIQYILRSLVRVSGRPALQFRFIRSSIDPEMLQHNQ